MELQELAGRTGLPVRKLRYVLDHDLVPGLKYKLASEEVGRPRQFSTDAAFGIACVGALLGGGMQRAAAASFMSAMLDFRYRLKKGDIWQGSQILSRFLSHGTEGRARVGDGVHLELDLKISEERLHTGWREPRTGAALAEDYAPRVVVELDLGRLRHEITAAAGT